MPAMQAMINGFEINAFPIIITRCLNSKRLPENQISIVMDKTLINGMIKLIRMPKYRTPSSSSAFIITAIPIYVLKR